jgi:hypothetical protein
LKWKDKGQKENKIIEGENKVWRRQSRKLGNAVIKKRPTNIKIRRKREKGKESRRENDVQVVKSI